MRHHSPYISRLVTFIVALQILNAGLFAQDFQQMETSVSSISEQNIINSFVEYVSEVVLEKVNAFPETNNKSNRDLQLHKHFVVKMVEFRQQKLAHPQAFAFTDHALSFAGSYACPYCKEINPPPPKA